MREPNAKALAQRGAERAAPALLRTRRHDQATAAQPRVMQEFRFGSFKIALKEMKDRVSLASVPGLSPDDIGPYRFNLIGIKHIIPWRHIALPVSHGIDKTCMGIARKVSQIDRPLRIAHTCAVASCTVPRE
jgi:hypothetical protein